MKTSIHKVAAGMATTALLLGLSVDTAQAAGDADCNYSFSTKKLECGGDPGSVRAPGDVISAELFSGEQYTGHALRVWTPAICNPDDSFLWWYRPNDSRWSKNIRSIQAWNRCEVFLVDENGTREGPYSGSEPVIGRQGTKTVEIQLN